MPAHDDSPRGMDASDAPRDKFVMLSRPEWGLQIGARSGFSQRVEMPGTSVVGTPLILPRYKPQLTEYSEFLDNRTKGLFERLRAKQAADEQDHRIVQLNTRAHYRRELLRRKAERETVENLCQTPFVRRQASLKYGFNVFEDHMHHLRHRYERAKEHGGLEALDLFDKFMRHNRYRVEDLFSFVDHDHSGSIDRKEFREALDYVNLKLDDDHFEALFEYLDVSRDGLIQPTELEDAMKHHRRFKFEAPQVEKFENKAKEMKRRGVWSAESPSVNDFRRNMALSRMTDTPTEFAGDADEKDSVRGNSIPIIGQQLMAMSIPSAQRPESEPMPKSVYTYQAEVARIRRAVNDRKFQSESYNVRSNRRTETRAKVAERRKAREELQSRCGQKIRPSTAPVF